METEELQKLREKVEENNKLLREMRRWMRCESEKLMPNQGLELRLEEQTKLLGEIRNWIKYTVKDQLDHISAVYATLERMYDENRRAR